MRKHEHLDGELGVKYPNGVAFKETGYPDFSPYSEVTVEVNGLKGTASDFAVADAATRLEIPGFLRPSGYTRKGRHGRYG